MIRIAGREIGDGAPVCLVFEAGPTHNGLDSAKQLATYAKEAGADAIKWQMVDPDRLVADKKQLFSYGVLHDRATGEIRMVEESLYDILCRRTLSREHWRALKEHCDSLGLLFFLTVTFDDELEYALELGSHSIKIASADINHKPFIRKAARAGVCLQLDTGSANIGEVERAVDWIGEEGGRNVIIHHCPTGYPARLESIHLRVIPTLKHLFPYPVAYSDHTPGWEMDIAAVSLGANLVEKTITADRTTPSVEHAFSLEPPDMHAFVRAMRDLEIALGNPRRTLTPQERERRNAVRRSAFAARVAPAGTPLGQMPVVFRRPGHGIPPDVFDDLAADPKRHLVRDLAEGQCLDWGDIA